MTPEHADAIALICIVLALWTLAILLPSIPYRPKAGKRNPKARVLSHRY
jgi:hypothetical protein